MLEIIRLNKFKKDYKRIKKRNSDISKLLTIIALLIHEKPIPKKYCDHALSGDWKHHRELHIEPDWVMIYKIAKRKLFLVRTGTHSDLF